jgi:Stage II sporulation protein
MIARIFMLLLAFIPFTMPVQAIDIWSPLKALFGRQSQPPVPTIKILVLHDQDGAILEVEGKYKIFDPHTGSLLSTRFLGKSKFIQPIGDGLKWGEEFPGHHQLELVSTSPETKFLVNGVEYKGLLTIYDIGGTLSIVNEVPIEEYLSLTLDTKLQKDLSEEALAALIIAERTNAYYLSQQPKRKFWAVDATQNGYQGFYAVDANSPVQKAIKSTRNMVMSRTGTYEGVVTPFPAQWNTASKASPKLDISKITMEEVNQMADNGSHAANILEKAFPKTTIQLIN